MYSKIIAMFMFYTISFLVTSQGRQCLSAYTKCTLRCQTIFVCHNFLWLCSYNNMEVCILEFFFCIISDKYPPSKSSNSWTYFKPSWLKIRLPFVFHQSRLCSGTSLLFIKKKSLRNYFFYYCEKPLSRQVRSWCSM